MDDITPGRSEGVETEAKERWRLAWEAERIAEARAQLDAGFYVDAADVDAWIDSLDTDNELPPSPTRRICLHRVACSTAKQESI
jgi:hypothetical protein